MYEAFGKRLMDLTTALISTFLAMPLLAVAALSVRLCLGRPIFFSQQRPGLFERLFRVYKFRTMTAARDGAGKLLPDGERLTTFGRLMRSTSLDELPELFNVLRGDMSLVGPRPLLVDYLPRYSPLQKRRHEVRPGITGLTQVSGRNAITWEEKFDLDVWYVDHLSFWLDIEILCLTVWKIVKREGISQPGHATMEEFRGSAN